jgi:hypothetical protein
MHNNMRPFQSIEGTLEFMKLLDSAIDESSGELRSRLSTASLDRYKSGLTLALYKLNQLSIFVQKSKRILNDLSLIRTALVGSGVVEVEERSAKLNEANSTLSSASLQELKRSLLGPVDLATSKS